MQFGGVRSTSQVAKSFMGTGLWAPEPEKGPKEDTAAGVPPMDNDPGANPTPPPPGLAFAAWTGVAMPPKEGLMPPTALAILTLLVQINATLLVVMHGYGVDGVLDGGHVVWSLMTKPLVS